MKKILSFLFIMMFGLSFVGCESPNDNSVSNNPSQDISEPHEHTFANLYSKDETYHWYAATCEHENEVKDKAEHNFDEGVITLNPTVEEEGIKFIVKLPEIRT